MLNSQDKIKLGKSQKLALEALQKAGAEGITTMQGISIAGIGFGARTRELRELGYIIKVERIADDRLSYRYKYLGYSASPQLVLFEATA